MLYLIERNEGYGMSHPTRKSYTGCIQNNESGFITFQDLFVPISSSMIPGLHDHCPFSMSFHCGSMEQPTGLFSMTYA